MVTSVTVDFGESKTVSYDVPKTKSVMTGEMMYKGEETITVSYRKGEQREGKVVYIDGDEWDPNESGIQDGQMDYQKLVLTWEQVDEHTLQVNFGTYTDEHSDPVPKEVALC